MNKKKQGGKALFKILGVLVGIVFVVMGVRENQHVRSLKNGGKAAVVEPISGYTEHRKRGTSTYTAEFTFPVEGGRKITKRSSFPEAHIEDFKAGRAVKVYYDASDPTDFIFEKDGASWFLVWGGVGIAVAALVFG